MKTDSRVSSRAWLTSFGDLLTLLLCFFVLAIFQSAKQHRLKNESKQVVNHVLDSKIEYLATSGKQIASKQVTESPHYALKLSKEDFRPSYAGLSDSGVAVVQEFLERTEGNLEVQICNVGFDYSESVFDSLETQFAQRAANFRMGAKICKDLKLSNDEIASDTIFLNANAKESHGRR